MSYQGFESDFSFGVERFTGANTRTSTGHFYLEQFLMKAPVIDVINSITISYLLVKKHYRKYSNPRPAEFQREVSRILEQEQISFEVDQECGVHPRIDKEFSQSKAATIRALSDPRFSTARGRFEAACDELRADEKASTDSIDRVFKATENIFKQLFPRKTQLKAEGIKRCLNPRFQEIYETNLPAKRASTKMCASFSDWVDAAHFFRHEHGHEVPTPAPLDFAVLMVSQGAGYLRWLAENFDAIKGEQEST